MSCFAYFKVTNVIKSCKTKLIKQIFLPFPLVHPWFTVQELRSGLAQRCKLIHLARLKLKILCFCKIKYL